MIFGLLLDTDCVWHVSAEYIFGYSTQIAGFSDIDIAHQDYFVDQITRLLVVILGIHYRVKLMKIFYFFSIFLDFLAKLGHNWRFL